MDLDFAQALKESRQTDGNYYLFVENQLSDMKVDDVVIGDFGFKNLVSFRMSLNRYAGLSGKKFKTKVKKETGELYIVRIL